MNRILYISDLGNAAALFHSQVIPHITELRKYFDVDVMVLNRHDQSVNGLEEVINFTSLKGDYIRYFAWLNFIRQKIKIAHELQDRQYSLIYSRGVRGGLVGGFIKNHFFPHTVLLNDIRGDAMDGMNNNFINTMITQDAFRFITAKSQLLFIVSAFLKEKICREYNFNCNNAFVFPTFVADYKFDYNEENRKMIRNDLNFRDTDIVILYSGTLHQYQNFDTILSAFKKSSNSNLRMLILSKDREAEMVVTKYNISSDKVRIRNVSYDEIEKYYHAADFGILIRDNNDMNKSAAPTKFAEYINSGLSVIINSIEAEYVRTFKNKRLKGVLLERKEDLVDYFNNLDLSDIEKNEIKINVLSDIVKGQKQVLENVSLQLNAV